MNQEVYRRQVGAILRGLLNDLKRNDATAALELGIPVEELQQSLLGPCL